MGPPVVTSRPINYTCDVCKLTRTKDELVAKRVQYREMGSDGKVLKTRVIKWVCRVPSDVTGRSCLDEDADFHRPKYEDAPGTLAKRDPDVEEVDA